MSCYDLLTFDIRMTLQVACFWDRLPIEYVFRSACKGISAEAAAAYAAPFPGSAYKAGVVAWLVY